MKKKLALAFLALWIALPATGHHSAKIFDSETVLAPRYSNQI